MAGCEVKPDKTGQRKRSQPQFENERDLLPTVNGDIDNIGSGSSACEHACSGDTGSVVGVDVDRQIRVSLSDSANQPRCQNA